MAMFSKGKGLFGAPMMSDAYEVRRSAVGAGPVQQDSTVPSYKKPSTGQMIAGVIGDTLSQWGGGQGTFLPGLQARQQQAEQAALYQRKRADEFTDWQQRQEYSATHPAAQAPTEFERVLESSGVARGSPEWMQAMAAKVRNTTDPFMTVPLPTGTYVGPQSGFASALGGGGGGAQPPRTLPKDFDFGGPARSAPGGFR